MSEQPQRVPEQSSDNMSPQAHPQKSEQPQEWTVEDGWLRSPDGQHFSSDHLDRIAWAINAALAAANRKYKPQVLQDSEARVEELERQLAVERKKYKELQRQFLYSEETKEFNQLREQLAAERVKVKNWEAVALSNKRVAENCMAALAQVKEAK
jgi:hypothetical protein